MPNAHQAAKMALGEVETMKAGEKPKRHMSQRMLDRYLGRGNISIRQYDAGNRLFRAYAQAGGLVRITSGYNVKVDGSRASSGDGALNALAAIQDALNQVGRYLEPVLVAVCLYDESAGDWARGLEQSPESGMFVFRIALDTLADHYAKPEQIRGKRNRA